jgi:hypothetical protein
VNERRRALARGAEARRRFEAPRLADPAERRRRLSMAFALLLSIAEREARAEAPRLDVRLTVPGGTRPDEARKEHDHDL